MLCALLKYRQSTRSANITSGIPSPKPSPRARGRFGSWSAVPDAEPDVDEGVAAPEFACIRVRVRDDGAGV